jgi:hypothetical protein
MRRRKAMSIEYTDGSPEMKKRMEEQRQEKGRLFGNKDLDVPFPHEKPGDLPTHANLGDHPGETFDKNQQEARYEIAKENQRDRFNKEKLG